MNEKTIRILEYNKIIDRLVSLTASSLGSELARQLMPDNDIEKVKINLKETSDGVSFISRRGSPPLGGIHDIKDSIKRAEIGSMLNPGELVRVADVLRAVRNLKNYSSGDNIKEEEDNIVGELIRCLEAAKRVEEKINLCIVSEEEISDNASPALGNIRRQIRHAQNSIKDKLNELIRSPKYQKYMQDPIVTVRGDRYVIPVKQEYRAEIPGLIHDSSASGATLFIEPMAVVEANNAIRELKLKEQAEIERILRELSADVAEIATQLNTNITLLAKLDFIFAKAKLSLEYNCVCPKLNSEGKITIKKGRHPLLDPKTVVPIDFWIGEDFHTLVVTGPNTGGKTVTLKTVGLLTLMGQAGLHIPAFDGSDLAVFEEVYADIGDEQSIEQSLSTFSSHMTNIVKILEQANEQSLVLFDELGAGTDPTEGAALAMSILSYLHKRTIRVIATTHYSELKIYALSTKGVSNASCEFDVETLRPTYRLLIGIPGKSNAFAISKKLGLPDFIIADAKERIGAMDKSFEDVISNLEASRIKIEEEQKQIAEYKAEIEELKKKLAKKTESLEASRERILKEAKEEAAKILNEAKEFADQSIKRYNKWLQEGGSIKDMEEERLKLRERLSENQTALPKKTTKQPKNLAKSLKIGDSVNVISLGLKGTVSSLPNAKGDLYVQMGILRSLVNINDIELLDEEAITAPGFSKTQSGKIRMSKSSSIHPDINLIGKTVDEAISELDKYLDDAYLAHLPQVTIIHGRGTGALRNAIHSHLKKLSYVKSFRVGGFGEGDHGVTIVEFK